MDAKAKTWTGAALLVVGTVLVFGLSAVDGTLVALAAVASVAALTAGTLLTGTADEAV